MKDAELKFDKEMIKKSKYSKFQDFHNLMRFRIRDILLVSSLYDSYIFEEDGRLYELIREEYQGLNLSHSPELIQCSSGYEAIELAQEENRFNLIITTLHIEDMPATTLARKVKESGLNIPVVLLGYDNREMLEVLTHMDISVFDKVFIWQGDYRIILGIIKYLEDRYNVEHDSQKVGVQSIILIEDNIRFYSSYLPIIYTEVLKQSQNLISEGINLSHKFLRMRARPKILLCSTYEEAWNYYQEYEEFILGIISDIDFSRGGKPDPKAGIRFAKAVKEQHPDIPILLQSTVPENEEVANNIDASFLLKDSPTLLQDLRHFMIQHFSFGDFVFKKEDGEIVGRARNLTELEEQLKTIPDECLIYHASRNHFSNWLKARTEFWLAHQLRPKKVSDFESPDALRKLILNSVHAFRKSRQIGVISDFHKDTFDVTTTFARIGGGSLGGKARGLGFTNNLLSNFEVRNKFHKAKIFVPAAVVVGTDVFDQFLDDNNLREFALRTNDDDRIKKRFLEAAKFPDSVLRDLSDFLGLVTKPVAVRSSSLLEDSQGQPFAGVYDTIMLPNNHEFLDVRLAQLLTAIKRIYASIFYMKSKDYIRVTSYRLEEEKMAIIIQEMVGTEHNEKFYPEFAGVAKSYNFYPVEPLKSSDGIVSAALGLGKTIVEGGHSVRFCPKYPQRLLQYSTIDDQLKYTPKEFYALCMNEITDDADIIEDKLVKKYSITEAYNDGTLDSIGSTYSHENNVIYDGVAREGVKLFTMAPLLKYQLFPLPQIIDLILELGSWGMGSPVEIEFAVNLSVSGNASKEFALLQMRPLVISNEQELLEVEGYKNNDILCKSDKVLGNGIMSNIHDIVYVDMFKFDRSKSSETSQEIGYFNSKLLFEQRPYLLIGVGRWGTLDPWLGIPVTWEQINGARAIIESNFKEFNVTPSQGSHFFQNLTSFKVGYFTVDEFSDEGFVDWDWLNTQKAVETKMFTRHLRLSQPLTIIINGQDNKGIILKPNV